MTNPYKIVVYLFKWRTLRSPLLLRFKDIAMASGKTEGVIRSIFEYFDTHLKDSFWDLAYSVSKKYNMNMFIVVGKTRG